jgi:hypothetical protein
VYFNDNPDRVYDTGVFCNQDTVIDVGIRTKDTNKYYIRGYLYGAVASDDSIAVTMMPASNHSRFGYAAFNGIFTFKRNSTYTINVTNSRVLINGSTYNYKVATDQPTEFTMPCSLIFGSARLASGAFSENGFEGYVHYLKIYDGDTLILDWVPCITPDDKVGFYDKITKTFITPIPTTTT